MDKKALRKLAQMKRHELPPLLKAQFDENIRSQLIKVQEPYQKIGMYISINDEADTRRILQHLLDQGKQIAVPKWRRARRAEHAGFLLDRRVGGLHSFPLRAVGTGGAALPQSSVVRAGADDRPGRRIRLAQEPDRLRQRVL